MKFGQSLDHAGTFFRRRADKAVRAPSLMMPWTADCLNPQRVAGTGRNEPPKAGLQAARCELGQLASPPRRRFLFFRSAFLLLI